MLMTMEEIKPLAIAQFNLLVTDAYSRDYFSSAFDLWEKEDSLFEAPNPKGYQAVIMRFSQPINEELARIKIAMDGGATRTSTAVNSGTNHETDNINKVVGGTDTTTTTENDGEFTQTARKYPDGYIDAPDASYIMGQNIDSAYVQTTNVAGGKTLNDDTTGVKDTTLSGTNDITEKDEIARSNLLHYTPRLAKLIEGCVFAFLYYVQVAIRVR